MCKLKISFYTISVIFLSACEKEISISDPGNLVPKTVEQDQSLPYISVNGTQFHAETFGNPNDPMVVFLHGGPGADYRNGLNAQQLADNGYFMVFFDQRGCGLSKRHNKDSYSIQLLFDDLAAVIAHYRNSPDQKIFLFGHSWGAIVATGYINKYPERIQGVILAEPGGLTWDDIEKYNEKSKKNGLFTEATSNILNVDQFITGKDNQHEILDYKLGLLSPFGYKKDNEEGVEGASPFWRNGAAILAGLLDIGERDGYDFTTNLSQYTTNVLLLYSENNTSYGSQIAVEEASKFPNSQVAKINDTGHEMIYFKWNSVYPIVLNYLNSLK
ncbi:MAG: alpha/beta hydrolase [Flavobacteriaceae bacterium]